MASESAIKTLPVPLSGLHLLLTYECNYACDHCFVWGGPSQTGTMTAESIEQILGEADALGTIEWIYFEGGEAFLHFAVLRRGIRLAKQRGYKVAHVANYSQALNGLRKGHIGPVIANLDQNQDVPVEVNRFLTETGQHNVKTIGISDRPASLDHTLTNLVDALVITPGPWDDLMREIAFACMDTENGVFDAA